MDSDRPIALHTKYQTLRSLYGVRSPITHKRRSPLTPNTQHCDDSTKIDRPLLFLMTDRLK
ncbi:hypothetical protein [Microcoleus sp. CAWBG640]|uniref:hypothetical protein n=1 Tax=Microcoleus sp. CAWBG640 TaxID=2841653 RepID=UPI00312BCA01